MNGKVGITMNKYTRNIAYIAISAIFFSFLVLLFTRPYHNEIPYFGANLYAAIFFFLGLVSLTGGIIFLYTIKNEVRAWYLGIPLVVAIAAVTISSFLSPALTEYCESPVCDVAALFNPVIGQIVIYLLAPFSALFFYSLQQIKGDVTILVLISLGVSILFSGGLIFEIPMHDISPFLLFFMTVGMPVIGAEFLATCVGLSKSPG
jgi:hypothetical protein